MIALIVINAIQAFAWAALIVTVGMVVRGDRIFPHPPQRPRGFKKKELGMTVRTLIWKLEKMPPDALILIRDEGDMVMEAESVEHVEKLDEYPCAGMALKTDLPLIGDVVVIGRL